MQERLCNRGAHIWYSDWKLPLAPHAGGSVPVSAMLCSSLQSLGTDQSPRAQSPAPQHQAQTAARAAGCAHGAQHGEAGGPQRRQRARDAVPLDGPVPAHARRSLRSFAEHNLAVASSGGREWRRRRTGTGAGRARPAAAAACPAARPGTPRTASPCARATSPWWIDSTSCEDPIACVKF